MNLDALLYDVHAKVGGTPPPPTPRELRWAEEDKWFNTQWELCGGWRYHREVQALIPLGQLFVVFGLGLWFLLACVGG